MGYSTLFEGSFKLDKPLKPEHLAYLRAFNEVQHVKMRTDGLEKLSDPLREAVGLPVGGDGKYYIGVDSDPEYSRFIRDSLHPPYDLPSQFCGWRPSEDGQAIEWDGVGNFYFYEDWLLVLIDDFLDPWGYSLDGEVKWQGEREDDKGVMIVHGKQVNVQRADTQ